MIWEGLCSRYGERCIYGIVAKHNGRRRLGRSKRRWKNNIKMFFKEMGWRHELNKSGSG